MQNDATAFHLAKLQFAQPADLPEARLLIILFWGFLPALLVFLAGWFRKGLPFARKRALWILALLASLTGSWWLWILAGGPDDWSPFIIYRGIFSSWAVAATLSLFPADSRALHRRA